MASEIDDKELTYNIMTSLNLVYKKKAFNHNEIDDFLVLP